MEDVDGSGFSLTIPAFLIGKNDGSILRTAIENKLVVKMKADLEISHTSSQVVDVGLWYANTLDLDPIFLEELYSYENVIKNHVKISAHVITMQCPNCVFEVRDKECISDGLYCLVPPKDEIGQMYNVSDSAILYDALLGRCVYETTKDNPQNQNYLTYLNYLYNVR